MKRRRERRWRRSGRRRILRVLVVLAVSLPVIPPVRAGAKGVLLLAEVLPSPVHPLRWITPDPHRSEIRLAGTRADLYRPRGFSEAPGLVLVHGANPAGKDDPRIRDLAGGFARAGRKVLVPQLELRHERLDVGDLDRIRSAVRHLSCDDEVGVVGFSYGAGLALVALGETDDLQDRVAFAGTFGTYFDLRHLVQGVTTGTVPSPTGTQRWRTEPEALDLAAEQLSGFLGDGYKSSFMAAWNRGDPEGLDDSQRSLYELLANRDPARVETLIEQMPARLHELLLSLSPSQVASRIRFPVLALHARDDPAAPPSESRFLVQAVGRPENRLFEVGIFRHVTPTGSPVRRLGDGLRLSRFAGLVLSTQERLPRL